MISKKKLKQIENISVFVKILCQMEGVPESDHWTDFPPDTWTETERELWDLADSIEQELKNEILKLLL